MPTVDVDGVALHYRELGERKDRTLVFAHTVFWGPVLFDDLVSELAKDSHIIVLDIHGHGQSACRENTTLEEMTEDYYRLLKKLALSNITWIGYSIGGMIGMRFAIRHPEMVESLVLIATNARQDPATLREQMWQLWELYRNGHREEIAEAALPYFFAKATYEEQPQLVERYRQMLVDYPDIGGMFETVLAAFNRTDISDQLYRIKAPTLVVAGKEDISATPAEAELIASRIPNAQLEVIDDANHLLTVEQPKRTKDVIRGFLDRALVPVR